jgi:membrane protease subunit (stomatin/prohibitin family)
LSQFMEVIEFLDETGQDMVHRVPESGSGETKFGAMCVVRDSQAAVFFKDGRGTDVLGPGRHMLSTKNIPVLTKLLMLPWGFDSFFKAEVYFVNRKVFTDLKWGTRDPVAFKDSELGMVRLRAFGVYTLQVTEPLLFVNSLVGTQGVYMTDGITEFLRDIIVSRLNDLLGETLDTVLDLPKIYSQLAEAVKGRLASDFGRYGMELQNFYITSITPPEDVQAMIDQRSGMEAVGDLDKFMKFRAAQAIGDAAKNPGGAMGGGMGLIAGAGIGSMLPGMMFRDVNGGAASPEKIAEKGYVNCPKCHGEVPLDARFCHRCGHQMVVSNRCPECGKALPTDANFCSRCGAKIGGELTCPNCKTKLPPGSKFCTGCGEKLTE